MNAFEWIPLIRRGVFLAGGEVLDTTDVKFDLPLPVTLGGNIVGQVVQVQDRAGMWWGRVEPLAGTPAR